MKLLKIALLVLIPTLLFGQQLRNHQVKPGLPGTVKITDASGGLVDDYPAVQEYIPGRSEVYQVGDFVKYGGEIYECLLQTTTAPDAAFSTPPGAAWKMRFQPGVYPYVEGETYPDSTLVSANGVIYLNVLGAPNSNPVPGLSWEIYGEDNETEVLSDYNKLSTFNGYEPTVIVSDEDLGGVFIKDLSATVVDGGRVPVAGWRRLAPGQADNPMWYGAKQSYDVNDVASNTAIIQSILDQGVVGKTIRVPRGVWYDWTQLSLPDFSLIYDESGFDGASGSGGLPQSYNRIISRTDDNTGATNGNTNWITGNYHPGFGVQNIGTPGTTEARASAVFWQKNGSSPFSFGTQIVQELTDLSRPRFSILTYNNVGTGEIKSKAIFNFTHMYDRDRAGAMGFNIKEPTDATYAYGVEGVPEGEDANASSWLSKNMIFRYDLPQNGTGRFDYLWRPGVQAFWHRKIVRSNRVEYNFPGVDGFRQFMTSGTVVTESDATRYGTKPKIVLMPNIASTSLGVHYDGAIYSNEPYTGGVAKVLPDATVGKNLTVRVDKPFNLRITPASGDKFTDRPAGEYMQSSVVGSSLSLECLTAGVWSFSRSGKWTNQSGGIDDDITDTNLATNDLDVTTARNVNTSGGGIFFNGLVDFDNLRSQTPIDFAWTNGTSIFHSIGRVGSALEFKAQATGNGEVEIFRFVNNVNDDIFTIENDGDLNISGDIVTGAGTIRGETNSVAKTSFQGGFPTVIEDGTTNGTSYEPGGIRVNDASGEVLIAIDPTNQTIDFADTKLTSILPGNTAGNGVEYEQFRDGILGTHFTSQDADIVIASTDPKLYYTLITSSSAVDQTSLILPPAAAAREGQTISLFSVELPSSTLGNDFTTTTSDIRIGDIAVSSISVPSGETYRVTCRKVDNGTTYAWVLDGSASQYSGWGAYSDTEYTDANRFAVAANTKTRLPNNAGTVNHSQKPIDIDSFFTAADTLLTGRKGDGLSWTLEATVVPTAAANAITFSVDIGGAEGEIYPEQYSFPQGAGVARPLIYAIPSAYTSENFEDNGGRILVQADGAVEIHSIRLVCTRTHKAR